MAKASSLVIVELDEALLTKPETTNHDETKRSCSSIFIEEVKRIFYLGGPNAVVNLSLYFLQVISEMMVGHLGELYLSGTAIAIAFCAVTGFSVIYGMGVALDTLCGQAYGAKQYRHLGIQLQTAIFCLTLSCIPISLIWISMGKLLILLGQDPQISIEAGKYATWLIPALFAYAYLQPLIRYFQAQSLVAPLIVTACVSICFHVTVCWGLVFKSGLGASGGALATGASYWLNVILLGLYMKYSSACSKTRASVSMELFGGIREFLHFAIPSAAMACLQWWAYEFLTLLSGLLPNPKLEASVLATFMLRMFCDSLATTSTIYSIPEGLGSAVSTRISNELGAGNPQAARKALYVVILMGVSVGVAISSILFAFGNQLGYVFSNEKEVIEYVTSMAPLICLGILLNSGQAVLAGVARGMGLQNIAAYVNLGAFYLCGIPIAAVLAFTLQLRGKGFWIGILVGIFVQSIIMFIVITCQDWEKHAKEARERIFAGKSVNESNAPLLVNREA
ncbi:hypothetical protein ACFE04_030694 [Oxalis oulophora]